MSPMVTTPNPDPGQEPRLRLEVFHAFGLYDTARTAALAVAKARPDLALQVEVWDVFAPANSGVLQDKQVHSFPTVRLFRGEVMLAESTLAGWNEASMGRWIEEGWQRANGNR